eukprot:TRINITY_DN369_c0_g1_i2.p1 TRINITY_DN369_c0_g1~~TRINITY_DN369_c0_g1_i2.p1  ORF type:complete len:1346 (-),score=140.19 TRINITY_DN369_c0_g1_i2:1962-5999(-)
MDRDQPPTPPELIVRTVLGSPPSKSSFSTHCTSSTLPFAPLPLIPPSSGPTVVWFRGHDLRLRDHAALDAAVHASAPIVALYVLERGAETDGVVSYMRHLSAARTHNESPPDNISFLSSASEHSTSPSPHKHIHTACFSAPEDDYTEQLSWGPLSPNGGFALGRVQRWYLHHSLCVLRDQLQQLGITLVLRKVDCAEDTAAQVLSIVRSLGAVNVFWNKRYKPRAYPVDEAVKSGLRKMHVVASDFDSETLVPPSADHGHYHDFQSYARFWLNHMRINPPPRPSPPIRPENVQSIPVNLVRSLLASDTLKAPSDRRFASSPLPAVSDLELLDGLNISGSDSPGEVSSIGCVAATRTLQRFLKSDHFNRFASDTARRDGMATGEELATSRLSPHVRFGEISPRVLFWSVVDVGCEAFLRQDSHGLAAARLFLKNMSLREFGYYMLARYPSAAWKPIIPEFEVFPWEEDTDGVLTRAWKNGTTGFPIVDAAMRQLIREGWLHNRMRFLAASFFCKYLLLPWPVGAAHMVRTLVDGDEACNSLGWQWTAGCNSDSFPFSTLVNPLSLHTHTRSRARAADYVRKYVPELAHLPDRLVFAPWTASEEERLAYKLSLVPLQRYNEICQGSVFGRVNAERGMVYYPKRVVTGPQARYRARMAMEVMRKIFADKKQIRPPLTDCTHPWPEHVSSDRFTGRKTMCVAIVNLDDSQREPEPGTASEMSHVTTTPILHQGVRSRDHQDTSDEYPAKRPRVMLAGEFNQGQEDMHLLGEQVPKDFPHSRRLNPETQRIVRRMSELENRLHSEELVRKSPTHQNASLQSYGDDGIKGGIQRTTTVPRLKRPRSPANQPSRPISTPRISDPCESTTPTLPDDRLSVKSLLSPNISTPSMMRTSSPRNAKHVAAEIMSAMSGLPKLAQVAAIQRDAQFSHHGDGSHDTPGLRRYPPPSPSPTVSGTGHKMGHEDLMYSSVPSANINSFQKSTKPYPASKDIPTDLRGKDDGKQMSQVTPNVFTHSRPQHPQPRLGNAIRSTKDAQGLSSHPQPRSDNKAHPNVRDRRNPALNPLGAAHGAAHGAAPAAMFPPNAIPVTLMGAQFSQNQAAHMLMPYAHASGHLPVQALPHHPGSIPGQNTHGYFAMNHVGATQHHHPSSPFTWYPTMTPYMEFRPSTVPATMVPHMSHPFMSPGHNPIANPYQVDRRSFAPRPGSQGVPGQPPSNNKPPEGSRRRGPTTPLEREGIARRMAAMDYTDETYGGKHWEQWQAIALHLLNQYEFSEDTDRDTTRAYVRLCVLKDELRDANPNGPRVTVNHCKEVFRILNLPVTGEWDRRGHGGVRGPYVYGCVKRNGQHASRH